MKHLRIIIISLLLVNCSHDDGAENNIDVSQIPFPEASFKITLKNDFETFETINSSEFSFDTNGNVLAEKCISATNPEQSYFSTFQYDANGRIVSETRNNHIISHVIWNDDTAKVYDNMVVTGFAYYPAIGVILKSTEITLFRIGGTDTFFC